MCKDTTVDDALATSAGDLRSCQRAIGASHSPCPMEDAPDPIVIPGWIWFVVALFAIGVVVGLAMKKSDGSHRRRHRSRRHHRSSRSHHRHSREKE